MTDHDDFDRTLGGWFEAEALSPAPLGDLDRVLDATRRRRPRPGWLSGLGSDWVGEAPGAASTFGGRSLTRTGMPWPAVLVVLLVVAALVGGAILIGARLFQPSPLPTGGIGHLAYGVDGDIFISDWDGRNPVKIADGASDGGPTVCDSDWGEGSMWSPDGRHLAYRSSSGERSASGDPCGGVVVITDPVNKSVASFPGDGWLVSWSPNSTRVATWVDLGKTIGIYGFDGGRQALLTVPTGCADPGDFDPVWSADGTSLVIAGCVVPLDGGPPGRAPANDPRSHWDLAGSSDGSRFAYIDYPGSVSLVIAKASGTQLRVLAGARTPDSGGGPGAAYEHPVFSATGDRVTFIWSPALYDEASNPSLIVDEIFEVRVVDVATGEMTTLASASGGNHLDVLGFSPEGDRVLFSRSDVNYQGTSLWSAKTDGSDPQELVTGTNWGDWQTVQAGR